MKKFLEECLHSVNTPRCYADTVYLRAHLVIIICNSFIPEAPPQMYYQLCSKPLNNAAAAAASYHNNKVQTQPSRLSC